MPQPVSCFQAFFVLMFTKPNHVWKSTANCLEILPNHHNKHQEATAPLIGRIHYKQHHTSKITLRTLQMTVNINMNSTRCDHSGEHIHPVHSRQFLFLLSGPFFLSEQDREGLEWSIIDLFFSHTLCLAALDITTLMRSDKTFTNAFLKRSRKRDKTTEGKTSQVENGCKVNASCCASRTALIQTVGGRHAPKTLSAARTLLCLCCAWPAPLQYLLLILRHPSPT